LASKLKLRIKSWVTATIVDLEKFFKEKLGDAKSSAFVRKSKKAKSQLARNN
jgi:hypothetical protein